MNETISKSQSAFIKGRNIHDNFIYVRNMAKRYHINKTPMLLIKLDISKAFDSVRWDYLLSLIQQMGFPAQWRNWVAATFSTATSQVLLNGVLGPPITHGCGLRQGDLLSSLLFILVIDLLQRLLSLATAADFLSRVSRDRTRLRVSMYADYAIIFLKPAKHEVEALKSLLHLFGEVTGLKTNMHKTSVVPIRYEQIDLDEVFAGFPAVRVHFPIKYLGLPLVVQRLRKVDFQPFADKAATKLSG